MTEYARCRFFNGIQHGKCEADIEYASVRDSLAPGPHRWPCLQLVGYRAALTECPKRSLLTAEELAAEEAEITHAIDKALAAHRAGKCHVCGLSIEQSQVVGRCKYAACGHRIGQVQSAEE